MGITGPEEGPPYRTGMPIIDITAGMFSSTAILAALRARDLTGEGQLIDLSLLDTQIALLANVASNYLVGRQEPPRLGNAHPNIAPYEAFRARDRWFALAAANERQWAVLCDVIGQPRLRDDPRFADNNGRIENLAALREILGVVFLSRDAEEWLDELRQADLPCAPINTIPEAFAHPQADARDLVISMEHQSAGMVQFPGFPYKLSGTPANVRIPPPMLGQHTEEVLLELLDYTPVDVAELRHRGAI